MKTKAANLFLAFLLAGVTASPILAEEAAAPAAPVEVEEGEELEYTFGTVKSVSADQIVINEFDYDTGEEKEQTYALDSKVELNNAASLQEIAQGDEVDVDYRVEGDKKIAQVISIAKPLPVGEAEGGS